jgi:tRNA-dihydrouridine synthase
MNFWQKLKKDKNRPLMVLAPMADVTDPAFRCVIAKYGKPDVIWTEFVSADGLFLGGYEHLIPDLQYSEIERPIVAQFFTSKPEMMYKAAKLAVELGFDGVDINMGCPDKSVEKQGAGAALIKNPELAKEIILAAKKGVAEAGSNIPVSVKTRIGYNKDELGDANGGWLYALLEAKPALITIHARTRKEMSLVPARWQHVQRAVEIRDEIQKDILKEEQTLIFGNGDVLSVEDGIKKCEETGADGAMLGRAIFGTPWLFANLAPNSDFLSRTSSHSGLHPSAIRRILGSDDTSFENVLNENLNKEILNILIEHTNLFAELLPHKSFAIMKKHFKSYLSHLSTPESSNEWHKKVKDLRLSLMEAENAEEVEQKINSFFI